MIFTYEGLPDLRALDVYGTNQIVLTLGCFDVLHNGHGDCIDFASSLGNTMVVGIWGDDFVRAAKGPGRPINTIGERVKFMNRIKGVDVVFPVPDRFASRFMGSVAVIQQLEPDVFVLGGEASVEPGDMMLKSGRTLAVVEDPTYKGKVTSTTQLAAQLEVPIIRYTGAEPEPTGLTEYWAGAADPAAMYPIAPSPWKM